LAEAGRSLGWNWLWLKQEMVVLEEEALAEAGRSLGWNWLWLKLELEMVEASFG
jgi:hypothetical protein